MDTPYRRLVVSVDMQRYSRRRNIEQFHAQQRFQQAMTASIVAIGLDHEQWMTQQGGDSELAILPVETPEPLLVGRLPVLLDEKLRECNRELRPESRVRLRMAVHEGLVHLDGANGFPSDAVIQACRLCDADIVKQELDRFPDANLALVVSDSIHRDVVAQEYENIRADRFRRITVQNKEYAGEAWLTIIGEDLGAGPGDRAGIAASSRPPFAPAARPQPPEQFVSKYTFNGMQNPGPTAIGDNARAYISPTELP
jgi:hypothetical protein